MNNKGTNNKKVSNGNQDVTVEHGMSGLRVTVETPVEAHCHRKLKDIEQILAKGCLAPGVYKRALAAFRRLAEAEARVHNTVPEDVHFHEVGALDSIADITGTAAALELLQVESISFSPLPLGQGSAEMAHGIMPLPAPATADLLRGWPIVKTEEPFELITPTGATLLTTWATTNKSFNGRLISVATGIGHRKLKQRPNILRAMLFDKTDVDNQPEREMVTVLETQIDDQSGELTGAATEKLLKADALDVFTVPVFMKKQRPGILLTVICRPDDATKLKECIFRETVTFGIRERITSRTMLKRAHITVKIDAGEIRVKTGSLNDELITLSPEYDDCLELARKSGKPLRTIYQEAQQAAMHF